ncbi:MAG: LPP20 family lipoprotein [Deltaproteobacteria bacterium]|nr:LPP20 family lipoprotein [Deltaproteobacteria bacterium]
MRATAIAMLPCLLAIGCTHDGPPPQTAAAIHGTAPDGTPRWVRRGSGAYDGDNGKAFYGVGIVRGIQNPSLSRQTASNRARGEVATLFDAYIAKMMKDYQRSTATGDLRNSAEEQDVVSAQKTITEVTLRGVEVRDTWTDPQTGDLYALAVLDLNGVMKGIQDANQLNGQVRDYVRNNARRAFGELDDELRKRSNR